MMDSRDAWFRPDDRFPETQPPGFRPLAERAADFGPPSPQWPDDRGPSGLSAGVLLAVIGSVVLGGGLAGLLGWHVVQQELLDTPPPPRAEEPAEEKFRQAAAAFSGEPAGAALSADHPDRADVARIQALFEALGQGVRHGDRDLLENLFDFPRTWQEVRRAARGVRLSRWDNRDALAAFRTGMLDGMTADPSGWAYERFRIKACHFDDERKEAVVYVRRWTGPAFSEKYRWWLARQDGQWVMYDYENLETLYRWTTVEAALWTRAFQGHPIVELDLITRVEEAMSQEDWNTAEALLDNADVSRFPRPIQALHWSQGAVVAYAFGRFEQVLEHCDRAETLHPDMPILNLHRAAALNALGRYEEARRAAQRYLDLLGTDNIALGHLGTALAGLARTEDAIDAHRRALDHDPDSYDSLLALAGLLPEGEKAEVGERFARFRHPEEWFDTLCGLLALDEDVGSVESLVAAYTPLHPDDPDIAYYGAWVLLRREQYLAAAEMVHPVLRAVQGRGDEPAFIHLYLDAMTAAGRMLDGYRRAPDAAQAFHHLATAAAQQQRAADLRSLLAAHREAHPDDPWLLYHAGVLAGLESDWEAAVECYRAGWQAHRGRHGPEDDMAGVYREELIGALYQAGRPFDAFNEITPGTDVFPQLAWRFEADEDGEQLAVLIEMHRAAEPDDSQLDLWSVRLLRLKQDHAAVIRAIEELLRTGGNRREEIGEWRWWLDDQLVRSHVHLGRLDEALAIAEDAAVRHETSRFGVLAHAARGDVRQTLRWLDRCAEEGYWIGGFYFDDMIGAALRSDAFESVREKYPEPVLDDEPEPAVD